MKKIILLGFLVLFFTSPVELFAETPHTDSSKLTQLYDRYNAFMSAGKTTEAELLRSKEKPAGINIDVTPKNAAQKKKLLQFYKAMTPVSYKVEHFQFTPDGNKAELDLLAEMQDLNQNKSKSELTLIFIQEKNEWKIKNITFGVDPDKVKRSSETTFEAESSYSDKETHLGGRIISTDYQKNYTLVTLRVLDEEYLVFLPSKKELQKTKFDILQLEPWQFLSVKALVHSINPLKVWALKIDAVPFEI